MVRTLLVVLAGLLAVDSHQPASTTAASDPVPLASPTATRASETLGVAPQVLGTPRQLGLVEAFAPSQAGSSMDVGVVQLQNRGTGVTCTMRIIESRPTVDPGIRPTTSGPHPDPMVRNSLSPCVE